MALPRAVPLILGLCALGGLSACTSKSTCVDCGWTAPQVATSQLAFDSDRTGNFEIYLMNTDGSGVRALTNDRSRDSWWPRISPDRTRILFYRTPAGTHDGDYTATSLWMMNADGGGNTQLIANGANGWQFQGHAEWSPDGSKLVMFAGTASNLQIFTTDAAGKLPAAITNRPSPNIDPSWSPDGATVAFIGSPNGTTDPKDYEVYTVSSALGSQPIRITNDGLIDNDPYFSPDGKTLAFLTQTLPPGSPGKPLGTWGIRKLNLASAPPFSNPAIVIDDGQINSKPDWSLDGTLIRFHRTLYFGNGKFSIFTIHPDGSGLVELTPGQTANSEFPSAGALRR